MLEANSLTGFLSLAVANLSSLSYLSLSGSPLSETIPREVRLMTGLSALYIARNLISGTIPKEIGNLKSLTSLALDNSYLTGSIPSSIGNLTNLVDFYSFDTEIYGNIPVEIGKLSNLITLQLNNNNLSGALSMEIGKLGNLRYRVLNDNSISGALPSLGNLTNLSVLDLMNNQLNGSLPSTMNNLTRLMHFGLSYNNFIGKLLDQICSGGSLVYFHAIENHFTGPIPISLKNCSSITRVRLEGNQLIGNLIQAFGIHPHLYYLNLNDNKLQGEVSPKWGWCQNLTCLNISNNNLSGSIPPALDLTIASKIEVEIFNRKGDFLLWSKKMRAVLMQMKVARAIDGSFPADLLEGKRLEMDKIALSTIILHLSDSVLRKVDEVTTTSQMWNKLEQLYLVRDVKNAIKYGRDSLSLDIVVNFLKSRNIELNFESKSEGLSARGRSATSNSGSIDFKGKSQDHSRSKSRTRGRKCYYCKKECHIMKFCYKKKRDDKSKNHENGDLVVASFNENSGESYKKYEEGQVLLGDDHSCKVVGIGYTSKTENGKMRISKGSFVAFKGIKKHGLYVLLGEAVFNSCNASVQTPVDNTITNNAGFDGKQQVETRQIELPIPRVDIPDHQERGFLKDNESDAHQDETPLQTESDSDNEREMQQASSP
ncbi:probable leucine-rich repeat receptor-like protein kinase At1g35710 [Ziziphus jujuba]|uniref:Probable leucine-rich repeat receptor-like protein kinase At1g35710 n=1 Tax=Ziziphus jujuba TaxID=326968 RepID=A0ABM3ZTV2_ZIZJJ|nr:probable leucine-rich repeat receptor-like protein kinase At1g35710 [Ziziphus jujuba]